MTGTDSIRSPGASVRRIVTGHTPDGASIVASDERVDPMAIGSVGSSVVMLWRRDDAGRFPDDGAAPASEGLFPPPGGSSIAIVAIDPEGDDIDQQVVSVMGPWADPTRPGIHRSPTLDYNFVLEGTLTLELDDGVEVTLAAGDLVVQNGTRHRWSNPGDTVARFLTVSVGAANELDGSTPPPID